MNEIADETELLCETLKLRSDKEEECSLFNRNKPLMCSENKSSEEHGTGVMEIGVDCNNFAIANVCIWHAKSSLQKSIKHLLSLEKLIAHFFDLFTTL